MEKKKVVVVEDHYVNRKLIMDIGSFHSLEMLEAGDGETALRLIEEHHPDLILMDVQLEGEMSGLDVAKRIKANESTRHIPIVAITAFAMKGDRELILSSGYEDYIMKPFEIQQLVDVFEKHLFNVPELVD